MILVRFDTTPDDIHGLAAAKGILTAHGGMASHAAVVARGMGKPCIAGCDALRIDEAAGLCTIGVAEVHEGDQLTIDGSTGRVILGAAPLVEAGVNPDLETILRWADGARLLGVGPTPTRRPTPGAPASSAPKASASAARSTCSSARNASRSSRR